MSFIQRLVSPKLPTALVGLAHVDLPGYDIWLFNIDNVHVLPTPELDVPKFEEALSNALQLYPHAAGQLRCNGRSWSIELTNTAVPMDIDYKLEKNSDSLLNGDWVIQDDISPFLNRQPVGANLINGGAPLLRFKLTFFKDETCIGVSWHHTLGDAVVMSRFMHVLSRLYQGLPLQCAAPTFKKYHFPTPSSSVTARFWPLMPQLHNTCPFSELEQRYAESRESVEPLRWRFQTHNLAELSSALSSQRGNEPYLSKQDCLIAYLVTVLNENRDTTVQTVTNTSSYHHIKATFVDRDVVGNLVQTVPATVPTDMAGIANAIRRALIQSREPDYIHTWTSVASSHMLQTANDGKGYLLSAGDDTLIVNSNSVIDWRSAHFGYPDGSRFHSTGWLRLYLRCFKSNPKRGEDGVWKARQSVDISIGVMPELKPKLLETLARGTQYSLNDERTGV